MWKNVCLHEAAMPGQSLSNVFSTSKLIITRSCNSFSVFRKTSKTFLWMERWWQQPTPASNKHSINFLYSNTTCNSFKDFLLDLYARSSVTVLLRLLLRIWSFRCDSIDWALEKRGQVGKLRKSNQYSGIEAIASVFRKKYCPSSIWAHGLFFQITMGIMSLFWIHSAYFLKPSIQGRSLRMSFIQVSAIHAEGTERRVTEHQTLANR